jgi:signal peptidase I
LWRFGVIFFAVLGVLFSIYHAGFEMTEIASPSMAPTLLGDERSQRDVVLCERVTYWFRSPRRWEIVSYQHPDGFHVLKRVVALPGETIALNDGRPVVDGAKVEPPAGLAFLHYYGYGGLAQNRTLTCRHGYFVLGDASEDSLDSRFEGDLRPERVRSRALLRVWPLSRFGFLTP